MVDEYWVYILQCADSSLYSGITNDIERRIIEHNSSPKGAKYTRARRPVKLVYIESQANRSEATKREIAIKKLSRQSKQRLILDQQAQSLGQANQYKVELHDYTLK